jgi:hypothetical protein
MNQRIAELLKEAAAMLEQSQSGYIPMCGEDEEWNKSRDVLVAELLAEAKARS